MQVIYALFAVLLFLGAVAGLFSSPMLGLIGFFGWAVYVLLWQILRTLMAILEKIGQPITITKGRPQPVPPARPRPPTAR